MAGRHPSWDQLGLKNFRFISIINDQNRPKCSTPYTSFIFISSLSFYMCMYRHRCSLNGGRDSLRIPSTNSCSADRLAPDDWKSRSSWNLLPTAIRPPWQNCFPEKSREWLHTPLVGWWNSWGFFNLDNLKGRAVMYNHHLWCLLTWLQPQRDQPISGEIRLYY